MRKVLVIAAGLVVLSGCANIPSTSEVHLGQTVAVDTTTQFIRVIARPPVDGMSPDAVLQSFLDACADSSNDFEIAREYLSSVTSADWNPSTGVQIYDASKMQITASGLDYQVNAPLDSVISSSGHRSVPPKPSEISEHFQVAKNENGQWRIDKLPNGLLLTRGDVERSFRSVPVYFLNPAGDRLVADTVLLPASTAGAATTLVKNLLSGASSELAGSVKSAFPIGTKLTYGSVPVNAGIAQVDLSSDVLAASKSARQSMSAQLVWTLTSLPNVSSVRLTVSGQQLAVPGVPAIQSVSNWQRFNPRTVSLESSLHVVLASRVVSIANGKSEVKARIPSDVATNLANASASQDGSIIAGTLTDGKTVVSNLLTPDSLTPVLTGEALSEPSFDSQNNILVADFGRGITVISADGSLHSVPVDANSVGSTTDVRSLYIAPDGVRVVLVFSNGATDILAIGALTQTQNSLRIDGVHRLEYRLTSVRDVGWQDPMTLQVLGSQLTGGQQIISLGVADGKVTTSNAPVGAQSLAIDVQGGTVLGVVDANKASIMRIVFGQWTSVERGSTPYFSP